MVVVGVLMLRGRKAGGTPGAQCNRENAPKVLSYGLGTGVFSGFFGIGGGFLIVPGLRLSTDMPMINAVGTSLVAVTAFGLTTAANYAFSVMVDRSEEHTSELQSLMRLSYAVFCLTKKNKY